MRPSARRGRRIALALALAVTVTSAVAISPAGAASTREGKITAVTPVTNDAKPVLPVTVESADGKTVEVKNVSRIVSLNGSVSEIVYALGLGKNVVGKDITTTFSESSKVPLVTRGHDVSAESVLSRKPTLVLAQDDSGPPDALQHIRDAGVPVVAFSSTESIDDIGTRIEKVAAALGVPAEGTLLLERTEEEIKTVQQAIPASAKKKKLKVAFLYMRGQAGVYLIGGEGSGADSMIKAAGGVDAGTAMGLEKAFTPITSEALVKAAPDVILMTTTGLTSVGGIDGLVEIPGIAQTPAGLNRRIVTEEDGLLFSFGSRTPVALAGIIDQLYSLSSKRNSKA
ncbi:MAG: ABC transporter substrate-binding protein [Acidimicrobiia bacterium]